MAANSGGSPPTATAVTATGSGRSEWAALIKPLVTYSVGQLSKADVKILLGAILDSKTDFTSSVSPTHPHCVFYDVVTVLSAHIITVATNNDYLPRSSFPFTVQAAGILCESLVARFSHLLRGTHPILTVKTSLNIVKELCSGKLILTQEEVSSMLALLKNQELPEKIQSSAPSTWDKDGTPPNTKDSRRIRLDPTVLLFDQITMPLISIPTTKPMKEVVASEVIRIFESLWASQKFVEVCISLPTLKTLQPETISLQGDAIRNLYTKVVASKTQCDLSTLSEELNLVYRLLSLPFFSHLGPSDAHHLSQLSIAALNAAFIVIQSFYGSSGSTAPSETDYVLGMNIVAEAIWTQKRILAILKEDVGLPQGTWLNYALVISKVLIHHLHSYMSQVTSSGTAESSKSEKQGQKTTLGPQNVSLIAVQGVWNELIVAVTSLTVEFIQILVGLNAFEPSGGEKIKSGSLATFKVEMFMTNSERIRLFFKSDSINCFELLTQLLTLSYRKACRLKLLKFSAAEDAAAVDPLEEDNNNGNGNSPEGYDNLAIVSAATSSATNAEVAENEGDGDDENHSVSDLMTTEDEEEEEDEVIDEVDDEPILGKWIESVLSPPEAVEVDKGQKSGPEKSGTPQDLDEIFQGVIGDRNCAKVFIDSALKTLIFLTKQVIANPSVQPLIKSSINEQIIGLISIVMKDLDQEKSSTESGAISTVFDPTLNKTYWEFSSELGKLVQNILVHGLLTPPTLAFFLEQLGIDLGPTGRWPLSMYPRSLAVLLQVLLLKPEKETIVVQILKRFMETLAEGVENGEGDGDIPVEHAQTLVFLFHTLSLMQKKAIMVETSNAIIRVSKSLGGKITKECQLLYLSRILVFFDYLFRQLYEPDQKLVKQIQYNLFDEEGKIGIAEDENSKTLPPARLFSECPVSASAGGGSSTSPLPKFYNLTSGEPNYNESPKLDGLAMNFLMNKNDGSNQKDRKEYSVLMDALLKLIEIKVRSPHESNGAAIRYVEYMLTRIMFSLPPPLEFLTQVTEALDSYSRVLYMMIWFPRLTGRGYASWLRDIFSKQNVTTAVVEEHVNSALLAYTDPGFLTKLLHGVISWMGTATAVEASNWGKIYVIEASLLHLTATINIILCLDNKDTSKDKDAVSEKYELELFQSFETLLAAGLGLVRKAASVSGPILDEKKTKSLHHLLTLSSDLSTTPPNTLAPLILRSVDPELKPVFEKLNRGGNGGGLTKFPDLGIGQGIHDHTESYLRDIMSAHVSSANHLTSMKHLLGSVLRFLGAGVNCKGKTTPPNRSKSLRDKFAKMLHPLPLDKTCEFISDVIGNLVAQQQMQQQREDSKDSKDKDGKKDKDKDKEGQGQGSVAAATPLTPELVEFMARQVLELVCRVELRAIVKAEKDDEFLGDCLMALVNFGKEEFLEVLTELVIGDGGVFLVSLVSIMATTTSALVLQRTCQFLTLLLSSKGGTGESSQKILQILAQVPLIETIPKSIFSPAFFQNEEVVEAGCAFLSALLKGTTQADLADESISELVANLLQESIEVTRVNMLSAAEDRPIGFHQVLKVLIEMASARGGHGKLFRQMTEWFGGFITDMDESLRRAIEHVQPIGSDVKKSKDADTATLNSILTILEYMSCIGKGLQASTPHRVNRETTPASAGGNVSPPNELEDNFDLCDSEMGDDQDGDEDSGAEDSDDEGLNTKLCTYTVTRREFMSQHWYHCHTCGMVDGVGVCSICARVCHKGHDVTYAKLGSFFCDCGDKNDGSCISMTSRPPTIKTESTAPPTGLFPSDIFSSLPAPFIPTTEAENNGGSTGGGRRPSSPALLSSDQAVEANPNKGNVELIQYNRDELMEAFRDFSLKLPLETIRKLKDIVVALAAQKTPIGAYQRIRDALKKMRSGQGLIFSSSENLMVATLGSQEGAFENIKMQYNGDQGALIRQLITAQVIRRSTIAAMSSASSRRHYLAVSQEKGKVTILQLAALLSGAEMSKKKLTLPRLATVTLPFTALTMATNPIRDDVLAICGLKDCQVLLVGTGGTVSSPLVVSTQLDSQNHIIKPVWIMGSQTELAVLTSDGVKIFDLGKDLTSPIYHFLLPAGKVRDATFVIQDESRFIVIMANDGRIYSEKLDEATSTANGQYYITNDLNYEDHEVHGSGTESGSGAEKGVSLYYSHTLKLLFYTYPNMKSYVGTLENLNTASPLSRAVLISPKSKPAQALGLAQWMEVPGHPGLVFAIGANSNPYILLLTENSSEIQEVRTTAKVKPIDFIAVRHIGSPTGRMRTSLLILSDDGSLRVCDTTDCTEFWLNSRLRPHIDGARLISTKSSAVSKNNNTNRRMSKHTKIPGGQVVFPVDFFEHCQAMSDIEFGGSDLLQIYNTAQLKSRLNNTGMYVVSTKSIGFNLEVMNNENSMVITGLRVLLGTQEVNRVPTFIQVYGRTITVNLTRPRWYDIPLTREESLQSDQKLTITFGPSNDPATITIVDSVKIYGKSKEAFGWPDESDDVAQTQTSLASAVSSAPGGDKCSEDGLVERIVTNSLDLCDLALTTCSLEQEDVEETLSVATDIYLENYPPFNSSCRSLMCTALANKGAYYEHRDNAVFIRSITQALTLNEKMEEDIDPELFHQVVHCIKNIAIVRPQHIAQHAFEDIGFGPIDVTRIVGTLCGVFRKLVQLKPKNPFVVALDKPGIQRVEVVAMGLAEIIYSLMAFDLSLVGKLCPYLFQLLLSSEREISVPVRTVIVKRMRPKNVRSKRRVTIPGPSPPHCITPETATESPRDPPSSHGHGGQREQVPLVEVDEPIVLLDDDLDYVEGQDGDEEMPMPMNPLDAYMGEYPPVIDLQSDAEDEAMVELAIALSLQEQAGGAAMAIQGIQEGLQALENMHQQHQHHQDEEGMDGAEDPMSPPDDDEDDEEGAHDDHDGPHNPPEGGAESDATASPPPSDDEGSTVATEGSTMRNSEMGGSESSGSSGAAGPSSRPNPTINEIETSSSAVPGTSSGNSANPSNVSSEPAAIPGPGTLTSGIVSNRPFRIALLKAMSAQVKTCESALSLIPLLQVVLVILSELDGSTEEEISVVNGLISNLLDLMKIKEMTRDTVWKRTDQTEMALVILRMLSICVSRWRGSEQKVEHIWIAKCTATTIYDAGLITFLKELLHVLRATWKGSDEPESPSVVPTTPSVLKPFPIQNPPDFTPFFLKQYVKTHSSDVLEELPLLLSEMALRLPYQIKKVLVQHELFDEDWESLLCEMLQNRNTPFVRRQARKLLLNMAGTREKYHLLRDLYNMNHHIVDFQKEIGYNLTEQNFEGPGPSDRTPRAKIEYKYSQLVAMVEHLNICIDIATQRPASLHTFCKNNRPLQFIVQMSVTADESLTTAILTLLKIAIDGVPFDSKQESPMQKYTDEEKKAKSLAHDVIDTVEKRTFLEFIKKYLLEHSQVSTRWQAHSLLLGFFLTSDSAHQLKLIKTMWELWPFVPAAGSRAAQFVDILGYATLNNEEFKQKDLREQVGLCIDSIQAQGDLLLSHQNANLYSSLVPFVSVDGYYLESEPCEVCYNMDKPFSTQKLSNIKADAKFTATNQIIKLTTTLNIIRLSIRLTEVKKVRMIKTMAVYYSPKNISIVDLKNNRNLWQMARKIQLTPSQTEVKFEFSVPITAANLILEFIDFYENSQATAETLQCPRCSASVPAQPGVCSNCGENVFQCHKCRAINYDERDPFLCHSCGFCKYAKMDVSVLGKTIVAVDPIENEEDHKKAETAVSSILEKADQTYKQQQQIKGGLETMLQSIKERRSMAGIPTTTLASSASAAAAAANIVPPPASAVVVPHGSYAAVAAAANALNNNVAVLSLGGANNNIVLNSSAAAAQLLQQQQQHQPTTSAAPTLVLKNVQSLAYCYAIDCKNSYEELNRLMRKVGAYRKEMLKLDPAAYPLDSMNNITHRRCYGCMASGITLSLKLLQALMTGGTEKSKFNLGFLSFLLRLSQSAGSTALKEQVKNALCFFIKDDHLATSELTRIINARVHTALKKGKETFSDVSFETAEEISLLASLLLMYDSCWEIKLRCLMKIFTQSVESLKDPRIRESAVLPCLKIIQSFLTATKTGEKDKLRVTEGVQINLQAWLDQEDSFENWKRRLPRATAPAPAPSGESGKLKRKDSKKKELSKLAKPEQRKTYLMKKYGRTWIDKHFKVCSQLEFAKELSWVKKLIFFPGSIQTRTVMAALLKDLAQVPERRLKIMELLTTFLNDLPQYGESCKEFMELYRDLATPPEFAAFLNAKGALNIVCKLLEDQIEKLHQLEVKTLLSDLSQGAAVWELSRLLSTLAIPSVRRTKRVSLLSTVLGGYLALRRLRLHRTRPIDEAQEILLQLLEEITTGTEEETKVFMTVCVETLKKCPKEDLTTPVFVCERICSRIVHEESDVAEFHVSLEKDPQQEDFLQGRMLGNPYSSTENGIGPLMRDIKNKICTDCELVALLEDDNGMELLVNNRIISLDLPVKEVYKRIWLPTNGQIEPMRIVYRMRGLLGDATEEFIETFAAPSDGPEDNETTFKSANILVQCGGLGVVLASLQNLMAQQFMMSRGKPLIAVILKLLGYTVKIQAGREAMVSPGLNAVQTLLPVLQLCIEHDLTCIQGSSGVVHLSDQMLEILDVILTTAGALDKTAYELFATSRGSVDDIKKLLDLTDKLKGKPLTMTTLLKVIGCLTYTDKEKMSLIFDSYKDCWDFYKFDEDSSADLALKLEQICTLVSSIQIGPLGDTFKDFAIERGALEKCLDYMRKRAPALNSPLGRPDSDEWKEMVTRPVLKYVLRLLAGFAANHSPTQETIGGEIVCVIHQLEQVSSDEHVGSLAENALEALRSHEKIWKEVEQARRSTREEKKRMAMAMRQRQLNTLGMKTNEKGQVTTSVATILDQMEDLAEETGLICVICREGYKYQPTKVLGIYTYSKRCMVEENEVKTRKTYSYCTVSHFNVVHVDCHMAAIRLARSRDEWESASLQNASTRCNGLIPLWGSQVPESAFAACLARHNAYLQEATGNRDVGFSSGAHDIKLLLLRFAEERSFHEDTGGGGPESNLHLIPYLIHTALYVLNTTRVTVKESNAVEKFLAQPSTGWKDEWTTVEGVYYHIVVSLMVHSPVKWGENRLMWLKRIMVASGYKSKKIGAAEFADYRAGLIFFALIQGLYQLVFKEVTGAGEWPSILADYIRRNDEALVKSTSALLTSYQQQLTTATSLEEFLDILGLKEEIKSFSQFLAELWTTPGLT